MKLNKKQAAPAAQTQAMARKTLLQTYITSLLGMALCVAMFLSTSYAWFTSEVVNEGNEIYIGILDVGLYRKTDEGRQDLADNTQKLYDDSVRWEPGYTSLETLYVVNKGDLAFEYFLHFTDGKLDDQVDPGLIALAECFEVYVYNDIHNAIPTTTSYEEIRDPKNGWVFAGTLGEVLEGAAVFGDVMYEEDVRQQTPNPINPNEGTLDGKPTELTYTVALHMRKDADMSVMGHRITLNVKLVAYQLESEVDGFGNSDYDSVASETLPEETQTQPAPDSTLD